MNRLLAFLVALSLVTPLMAKEGSLPARKVLAPPAVTTINGNPLRINVGADNSYQIFNSDVGTDGQFYPDDNTETADSGWFVSVGGTLYAPNFEEHPGGTATGGLGATVPFSETSLSAVSGAGTSASPFTVSVVNGLGESGLVATKTITYVNGDSFYTERFRLVNTSGNQLDAKVFLGSDIYLANSDSGVPYREPTSGAPGGRTCPGVSPEYTILHIPLTPASRFTAVSFGSVWQQIGGGQLDNTVGTTCIDNGAALQWDYSIQPGGSATVLSGTSFGTIPPITQFNITDVSPSLGLVGSTVPVTIFGFGFQPATSFTFGDGIAVDNISVANANTASATLRIAANARFGWRDVMATQVPGGMTATLIDGFAVTDVPVWNYKIIGLANVSPIAVACVGNKFPAVPGVNVQGWAPDEGTWYVDQDDFPPFPPPTPPTGLARAILDCFVNPGVWDSAGGNLFPPYCWDAPTPRYVGEYPDARFAQLRIYFSTNGVCAGPAPGGTVFEENVNIQRQLFLLPPMIESGFEDN